MALTFLLLKYLYIIYGVNRGEQIKIYVNEKHEIKAINFTTNSDKKASNKKIKVIRSNTKII